MPWAGRRRNGRSIATNYSAASSSSRNANRPHAAAGWDDLRKRAVELATGPDTRRAFAVEQERPRVRDRYGRHPLGQYLLMARRLVEAGVGFVSVNGWCGYAPGENSQGGAASFTWDMHGGQMGQGNIFGTGSYGLGWALPRLDEALSALLEDLHERGLLKTTLVVVTGEFGRTPKITGTNGVNGRDHWTSCFSALIAGAGIGGGVYGASDKIGAFVKDRPVRPQDLGATVYHALGVPLDTKWVRGRSPRASRSRSCSAKELLHSCLCAPGRQRRAGEGQRPDAMRA